MNKPMKHTETKNRKIPYPIAFSLSCLVFGALNSGCQTPDAPRTPPPSEPTSSLRSVTFGTSPRPVGEPNADNPDPAVLVEFALSLSDRGRHLHAAEFLNDAADRFNSQNNEFAVACRAAAATELLLANDMAGFRQTSAKLKASMSRYQLANASESMAGILSLGEIANGTSRPSTITPSYLKDLYGDASSAQSGAGQ